MIQSSLPMAPSISAAEYPVLLSKYLLISQGFINAQNIFLILAFTYGTFIATCPGFIISITPPQVHISVELSLRAGILPMRTVGEPGAHGAVGKGTQGIGVNTP
jgi:hypothetical protein